MRMLRCHTLAACLIFTLVVVKAVRSMLNGDMPLIPLRLTSALGVLIIFRSNSFLDVDHPDFRGVHDQSVQGPRAPPGGAQSGGQREDSPSARR